MCSRDSGAHCYCAPSATNARWQNALRQNVSRAHTQDTSATSKSDEVGRPLRVSNYVLYSSIECRVIAWNEQHINSKNREEEGKSQDRRRYNTEWKRKDTFRGNSPLVRSHNAETCSHWLKLWPTTMLIHLGHYCGDELFVCAAPALKCAQNAANLLIIPFYYCIILDFPLCVLSEHSRGRSFFSLTA